VTRRAWITIALGAAIAVAVGAGFARAGRPQCCDKPLASWGMFTPAEWTSVTGAIARRGFDGASIRIVSATELADRRPFALIAAASQTGTTCVVPVRGITVDAATCSLRKPLVLFTARTARETEVLGIARSDVAGVTATDTLGHRTGLFLIPAGRLQAFAGGFRDVTSIEAHDAYGHTLVRVAAPSS
jgi:hypothetical protein